MTNKRSDPEFAGNGLLRCHICDRPVRDHPIGRCAQADGEPAAFKGPMTNRVRRRDP